MLNADDWQTPIRVQFSPGPSFSEVSLFLITGHKQKLIQKNIWNRFEIFP
jgi:hypothetical protein